MKVKPSSYFLIRLSLFLFGVLFIVGCINLKKPYPTIEMRQQQREKLIESYLENNYEEKDDYKSLAFGPLTIHKTPAFLRLDSLFDVKEELQSNYKFEEFKQQGIQRKIDEQRKIANEEKHLLKYEIEHIYTTKEDNRLRVNHSYFVLNHEDSILVHDAFYSYTIHPSFEESLIDYLFELHFISNEKIRITSRELDFIVFFKERELELIRTDELEPYMQHVMVMMALAASSRSVDFVDLAKSLAINEIKKEYRRADFSKFDDLMLTEDEDGRVLYYELTSHWVLEDEIEKASSTIRFSPYLEVLQVEHEIEES